MGTSHKIAHNSFVSLVPVLLLVMCCASVAYFISLPQASGATLQSANKVARDPVTVFLASVAAVVSLWNAFVAHQHAARLEEFKQQLNSKFPAIKETREAALNYYRVLASLENQTLSEEELNDSEKVMTQAEGSVYFLDEGYQKVWYEFWQEARNISTRVKRVSRAEAQQQWKTKWAKDIALELRKIAAYQK